MRTLKWIGMLAAITLIISCFLTWVIIPSKQIVVTGVDARGTNFGKPGYFHFITTFFFILFTFIQKIWAKRANLLVTAVNLAWAIRNFFLVTICRGGDCPEKHVAIFIVVVSSVLMLVSALFPDFKERPKSSRAGV